MANGFLNNDFTADGNITGQLGSFTQLDINIGASGDPKIIFDINGTDKWYIGVDDDDSDSFKIGTGATVGTNTLLKSTSNGTAVYGPLFDHSVTANTGTFNQIQNSDPGANSRAYFVCASENAAGSLQARSSTWSNAPYTQDSVVIAAQELHIGCITDETLEIHCGSTGLAADMDAATVSMLFDYNGYVTMPRQSAFCATGSASNVTGNNTVYTILFSTERFDLSSDYSSGTYTAPVTAYMDLGMDIIMTSAGGGSNYFGQISTSNFNYSIEECNDNTTGGAMHIKGSCFADMDAADTAVFKIRINGIGADTADVNASSFVYGKIGC